MTDSIGPVRPRFNMEEELPAGSKVERLVAGTKWHGMVVDVDEAGIKINGYYTSLTSNDTRFAVLREPIEIPWEEVDKLRARSKRIKGKTAELDRIEGEVDQAYLDTLSKVTILGKKYYIDPVRRERRSVEKPSEVWRFK